MMVEYQLFIYTCNSTAHDGVLYGYNILLHLATVVIAFKTRKVKVKVLNDYREIILATCISGFVLVLILVFTYTVTDRINLYSALTSFGLFVAATVIMVLVFVPKVTNDQQLLLLLCMLWYPKLVYQVTISHHHLLEVTVSERI